MGNAKGKSMYQTLLVKALAWGALVVSLTASPVLAQDIVGGHFTLTESARFGDTVLGAGEYKFTVEPVGTLQSVGSIQEGVSNLVQVVLQSEKAGTGASLLAMASGSKHGSETSALTLEPGKDGTLAKTLYLEKEGLLVDFRWASPKTKAPIVAQQTRPEQTTVAMRSAGNK